MDNLLWLVAHTRPCCESMSEVLLRLDFIGQAAAVKVDATELDLV